MAKQPVSEDRLFDRRIAVQMAVQTLASMDASEENKAKAREDMRKYCKLGDLAIDHIVQEFLEGKPAHEIANRWVATEE